MAEDSTAKLLDYFTTIGPTLLGISAEVRFFLDAATPLASAERR